MGRAVVSKVEVIGVGDTESAKATTMYRHILIMKGYSPLDADKYARRLSSAFASAKKAVMRQNPGLSEGMANAFARLEVWRTADRAML